MSKQAPATASPAAPATALPANWSATNSAATASAAAFAAFALPVSLQAKGAGLCGGVVPHTATAVAYKVGKAATPRSAHNAAWHAACVACIAQHGGKATAEQLLAAGIGWHSVSAYLKRQWLLVA